MGATDDAAALSAATALRARAGIGLRTPHLPAFLEGEPEGWPAGGWLEVHAENFMAEGGPRRRALFAIAGRHPVSLHGVGLSLGSAEGLDPEQLSRLVALERALRPVLLSEHLSWSRIDGRYLNDLLPLPYSEEALAVFAENLLRAQDALRRPLLIENPSAYLAFADSCLSEAEFLAELVRRTGCGLLLDLNNLYVSAQNLGGEPLAGLESLPAEAIGEIHLAGHARVAVGAETLLVDDHGDRVAPAVWGLYDAVLARLGPRPTLIEWDTRVPALEVLLAEAAEAQRRLDCREARRAA